MKDSLLRPNPGMKVFVMGDMNDDPTNESNAQGIESKRQNL